MAEADGAREDGVIVYRCAHCGSVVAVRRSKPLVRVIAGLYCPQCARPLKRVRSIRLVPRGGLDVDGLH